MTEKKHNSQHLVVSPTAIRRNHHNRRRRRRYAISSPSSSHPSSHPSATDGKPQAAQTPQHSNSIARARVVVALVALVVVTRTARLIAFSGFAKFPMYRDMVATIRASTSASRRVTQRRCGSSSCGASSRRETRNETKRNETKRTTNRSRKKEEKGGVGKFNRWIVLDRWISPINKLNRHPWRKKGGSVGRSVGRSSIDTDTDTDAEMPRCRDAD